MTDLDALIEKLAAATTGSRELDVQVVATIIGGTADIAPTNGEWCVYQGGAERRLWEPRSPRDLALHRVIYERGDGPTRSVDAALLILPDHHRFLLDKRPYAKERHDGYRAAVYREAHPYASDGSDTPSHWGPTLALALVIAILKARRATA